MLSRGQAMFEFLHNPKLLDAVESFTGPEIACNPIQHLRAKPPERFDPHTGPSFHVVPWHQDAGVMMPEAEGSNIVTLLAAHGGCDSRNGLYASPARRTPSRLSSASGRRRHHDRAGGDAGGKSALAGVFKGGCNLPHPLHAAPLNTESL